MTIQLIAIPILTVTPEYSGFITAVLHLSKFIIIKSKFSIQTN
jgi:hypothetical protein